MAKEALTVEDAAEYNSSPRITIRQKQKPQEPALPASATIRDRDIRLLRKVLRFLITSVASMDRYGDRCGVYHSKRSRSQVLHDDLVRARRQSVRLVKR